MAQVVPDEPLPARPFPLPRAAKGASVFATTVLQELEVSWDEEMKSNRFTTKDISRLHEIIDQAWHRVSQQIGKAASDIRLLLSVGINGMTDAHALKERLRAASNRQAIVTESDILRLAFTDEKHLLHWINPLKNSPKAHEAVRTTTLLWMQYCVLQDRLMRLHALTAPATRHDMAGIIRELSARREWKVTEQPQWLAFEVTGAIQIRPMQYSVAKDLMEKAGAIQQLNMGEGKTRVILPMLVMHALQRKKASGCDTLPRLHFLPQLLGEAYEYLHSKLCASELGIRLLMTPFNRDVDVDDQQPQVLVRVLRQAACGRAALLVSPEHRLSLQLRCVELRLQDRKQTPTVPAAAAAVPRVIQAPLRAPPHDSSIQSRVTTPCMASTVTAAQQQGQSSPADVAKWLELTESGPIRPNQVLECV